VWISLLPGLDIGTHPNHSCIPSHRLQILTIRSAGPDISFYCASCRLFPGSKPPQRFLVSGTVARSSAESGGFPFERAPFTKGRWIEPEKRTSLPLKSFSNNFQSKGEIACPRLAFLSRGNIQ
jgi:hypothetical protein